MCLGGQGGSTPFPPDLQELLQGVRNQSGQWSWEFCRVLCWRNPGRLGVIKVILSLFFPQCISWVPCLLHALWWTHSHCETEFWNCITVLRPEAVEQLEFSPQHLSGHLCTAQGCAVTSSQVIHTLTNSLPEWGDSCKPIPSQAMEFAVPLDSHTQAPGHKCTSFNLHSNFTTFIFLAVPQQWLYWTPFFAPFLTPSCQRIEKTIYGEGIGAIPFSPDTKIPILILCVLLKFYSSFTPMCLQVMLCLLTQLAEPMENIREIHSENWGGNFAICS